MTEHHWFGDHLLEFATEQLSPDDVRLVEEHLRHCVDCRTEVAAIRDDLRYLPMGAAPVPPRPGFNARVLRAAAGPTTPGRVNSTPWIIAALAASTVIAAGIALQRDRDVREVGTAIAALRADLDAARAESAALGDTLSIVRKAGKVVYASLTMPGQQGGVVLFDDPTTHRWQVVAHGLPALPAGQRYQFWFVCENGMALGVPMTRTAAGLALLTTDMPEAPPGRVMGAAITIESDQDAPSASVHGQKIATLLL